MSDQVKAVVRIVCLISDAIREAGPEGIASGLLYAAVCNHMNLDGYQAAISFMEREHVIERRGDVLVWIADTQPAVQKV